MTRSNIRLKPLQFRLDKMRPRGASSSWGNIDSNTNFGLHRKTGVIEAQKHKIRGRDFPNRHWNLKPLSDALVLDGDGDVEASVRTEPISSGHADFLLADQTNQIFVAISQTPNSSERALVDATDIAKTTLQRKITELRNNWLVETDRLVLTPIGVAELL
jgi:hypothetical protein